MNMANRLGTFIVLLLATSAWAQEAFPERVPVNPQAASQKFMPSSSLQQTGAIHTLEPLSPARIAATDEAARNRFANVNPGPVRVGLVRSVGATPLSLAGGSFSRSLSSEGENVWTLAIRSSGAIGIRIHFSKFDVGNGSVLVSARDAEGVIVHGPYTKKGPNQTGDFWTASLPGDLAFIEVSGADQPRLEVAEILHFDKHPTASVQDESFAPKDHLPCHLDVMCYNSPPVHPHARDAIGQMNYIENSIGWVCTGTLLNDLDNETFVPYFLTAFHCISTQAVTNTLEVVWFWQHDSCGVRLPNYFRLPRNTGGTLLETNPTDGGNDMSFIRLDDPLPGGVGLAGWTTGSLPASFVGIHHPDGSWKRVTFQHEQRVVSTCTNSPMSQYHYCLQDDGVTEGGSSGSGIFNDTGQLMGQLLGSCPPNNDFVEACDNRDEYNTMYGRFNVTYPLIRRWLEVGGTIHVNSIYTGEELGTPDKPFNTVAEAINFAWNGARIKIQAGSYPEALTASTQVLLLANGGTVTIGK